MKVKVKVGRWSLEKTPKSFEKPLLLSAVTEVGPRMEKKDLISVSEEDLADLEELLKIYKEAKK